MDLSCGATGNNFKERSEIIKNMLDVCVKNPVRKLSLNWFSNVDNVLNS